MTVLYGSNVANGTLATASTLSTNTGGTEVAAQTTVTGTSPYVEVVSRAATLASVTSISSPSGKGWVSAPGAGSFALGNWSATVTFSASAPGTTDVTIRFYRYSGGVYTSIGTINKTGITGTKTSYSFAATSMAAITFASSDLLYCDLWWHDTSGADDNPNVFVSNSATAGVANDLVITTSTFTAGTTVDHNTAYRGVLSKSVDKDTAWRGVLSALTAHNTNFRGNIGHTGVHDSTWLAVLSALTRHDTTYQGWLSQIADKNSTWRGNLAHIVAKNTTFRGVLANTPTKNTAYRGNVGHTATHDTVWRANLSPISVFYASNVNATAGGLNLSDQMARVAGGTETSVSVTMPASGTNSYVELLAQGGASSGTAALPAPTGKGWSINLAGNTILSGYWSFAFTLAKSGTAMTGASLYVRAYRRTMDGTCYYIASASLTGQTFSTTKTVYATPSANAALWQFIAGDTLYMDAFVLNPTTAWASDVFTVYVSNSATQGVYNDGIIIAPQLITTPQEIACYIGATSLQTGTTLPVLNQSFTLADAIDQRSILTLTGEDVVGSLSYQRGMPVYLGDHDQGLLYTGAVNSDKASKPAAGSISAQLEHMLTMMDNHYLVDKRKNETNYLNWSCGDMVCDFIQSTLSQEGVQGAFALESDYTPATLGAGTLSGTVATTTTSPFSYAPNTATPPITSNTGDLELTRAGTQFMLTESVTSDFSSGTLTNMTAANNELSPTTQSAIKVTAQYSPVATATNSPAQESAGTQTDQEQFVNLVRARIWSGSQTVGTSDTLNYDVWIASTSPAFLAGVDILFSDGSHLTDNNGTLDSAGSVGLYDSNGVSIDLLQDLSAYAKDTWYTRSIALTGLNGKTVSAVSVYLAGSSSGTYTVYTKNCYLGSHSGSPFFGTSATSIEDSSVINTFGGYLASTITLSVVSAYNPLVSYRVSPAHSISGVGLVQNSTITWTASLPTTGAAPTPYPPGTIGAGTSSSSGGGAMVMLVSYDGNAWLECQNSQALPGLPAGANVSGLSLYLREQFAAGSDPTAIPGLLDVSVTINSAANQTVSDVVASYGTSTQWNTGTSVLTGPNSNGNLTLGSSSNPLTQGWSSSAILNQQTFLPGAFNSGTQAVTGGAYTMTPGANTGGSWCQSRFDFAGYFQNGTIEADVKVSTTGIYTECGVQYRQVGWGNANNNGAYYVYISQLGLVGFGFGSNNFNNTSGSFTTVATTSETIAANTFYHLKVVVNGSRHTIYFNHNSTPAIDILDNTYTAAGQVGFRAFTSTSSSFTASIDNLSVITTTSGTWTSPSTSLTSLGTCGYSQVSWTDLDSRGQVETTATVLASIDGGTTWMQCVNGAEIPQLPRGTSTSGASLVFQMILYSATPPITTPVIMGLYARICGNYGTVSGTRISPALSLTPVGYVASSNCMWNANIPTSTSLTVQTTQDLSTYHTVGSNGAGEALPYWSNQPAATQDLFSSNTSANYTNTNKSGGSVASVTYTATPASLTLSGGSGALYLNNAISCADVDLLVDMGRSDAGGLVWRKVDASNFYELGVYDASSSGGFTNQLRLYKVASGTRSLLGSASSIVFTRGTIHRIRVVMGAGLINVYWDGQCKQSYLDTSPLGAGACGLRNDGGTSRYYQLWIQPLGTNLSGQKLQSLVTMTTSDPSQMPQLFVLVVCVRGPSIGTGATVSQLHPVNKPFAVYYSSEMDNLMQQSGDFFWYVDKWKQLIFGTRLARPGAFPVQSATDQDPANPANVYSGYLLYQPLVNVLSSADLFRSRQTITNVSGLVTPPPEVRAADGSTTSWSMGYPLYSAPSITINGQPATVGLQGIDNGKQFYWQPLSASISYDASLPKLPAGTVLVFTYVGESPKNVTLNNLASQAAQAALELNSGFVDEIESALNTTASGMTEDQATTFGQGLLDRYGNNNTIELTGVTRYGGLAPGTVIGVFVTELGGVWNAQLPVTKVTTTAFQGANGLIYFWSIDATNGPNLNNWQRVFYAK